MRPLTRHPGSWRVAPLVVTALVAFVATSAGASSTPPSWSGYHGGGLATGVANGVSAVNTSRAAWRSPVLDGELYGQPIVSGNDVIVATENDTVYALAATNGHVVWHRHVASPVPSSDLPCGNISPTLGITGTPVIDTSRGEVFVLAAQWAGHVEHEIYGLSLTTGRVELREPLTTQTSEQSTYLNRSGLALDQGKIVFTFGGNYGDCGLYHGVVGAVSESGPSTPKEFVVDGAAGDSQGAVWMGGAAPVVDARGNVWVESGNGSVTTSGHPYDDSDGLLELSSNMTLAGYFAPSTWVQDNANDADLSAEPAVLANGLVVAVGKSGMVYVVRASHLGGINGQVRELDSGCGDVLDGGVVVHGDVVYLPCRNGTEALSVGASPLRVRIAWHAAEGQGPPILVADLVWSIDNGVLDGLNPNNGHLVQQATLGNEANDFPTPGVGAGLLLAPTATQVVAFHAP